MKLLRVDSSDRKNSVLTEVTFVHAENQKPGPQGESARAAGLAKIQELTSQVGVGTVQ